MRLTLNPARFVLLLDTNLYVDPLTTDFIVHVVIGELRIVICLTCYLTHTHGRAFHEFHKTLTFHNNILSLQHQTLPSHLLWFFSSFYSFFSIYVCTRMYLLFHFITFAFPFYLWPHHNLFDHTTMKN